MGLVSVFVNKMRIAIVFLRSKINEPLLVEEHPILALHRKHTALNSIVKKFLVVDTVTCKNRCTHGFLPLNYVLYTYQLQKN